MVSPSEKGTIGYDKASTPHSSLMVGLSSLTRGGNAAMNSILHQWGERRHELDPPAGSLDKLDVGHARWGPVAKPKGSTKKRENWPCHSKP